MSTGSRADWAASGGGALPNGIIYPELVHSGLSETLVQNTDAFNQATRNAIRMIPVAARGDFYQESFFKNVSNLVQRRTISSTSPGNEAVAASELPIDENISVKLNRRIGPVDQTLDSFRKIGMSGGNPEVLSFALGEQVAKAMMVDQLDAGLRAAVAALSGQAASFVDKGNNAGSPATAQTLSTHYLIDLLATFGDAAGRVVCWVMHSKAYFDLVKDQVDSAITNVADVNIATAAPITLNRPVLVTDSAALLGPTPGGSPITAVQEYYTLGLTENGVVLMQSEDELLWTDIITGNQNLVARAQGEYAYNVGVKGFRWDAGASVTGSPEPTAADRVNPDDTDLANSSLWVVNRDSNKDYGGSALLTG